MNMLCKPGLQAFQTRLKPGLKYAFHTLLFSGTNLQSEHGYLMTESAESEKLNGD